MRSYEGTPPPEDEKTVDADALLMLEFQKGSRASFETLLRKYYGRIFNFNLRMVGSREAAEDLAQETFLRVFRNPGSFVPRAKFQTWLYTIARNLCLNDLRRRKYQGFSLDDEASFESERTQPLAAADGRPDAPAMGRETQRLVRQAIRELPPQQRMAVILRRYEDFSYEDIARTMGTSVPAVKSLLSRARVFLRQRLETLLTS